ncbi:DUF1707 domain-containing protein [Cryptosporangium sp. NPDC048952]|uniref:DUF1707 domain-containing protein n=1 Tax=Cryptosporangium sp. NPDC048952 TaxID=3363961 RepID=UPI0037203C5D
MSAEHTPPPRTRSSTVERERVVSILRAAAEAGLLTLDEADERMATCYASQYRDELAPLLADLPDQGRGLIPPDPEEQTRERQAVRAALGGHFAFITFLGLLLTAVWAIAGGGFFWPVFPLAFLALTFFSHAKHRKRHARWRAHLAAGHGPGDFAEYRDYRCGPRHHHRRWDYDYSSRSW